MCCILLAVYFVFICYFYYKERKFNYFLILANLLNLASLIYIITCPGNANRKIQDTAKWFPDFNNLSLFRKLEIGYSSTLFEYAMQPNFIFFIFSFLLFTCSIIKFKDNILKFIASIPLAFSLIFSLLSCLSKIFGTHLNGIKNSMTQYGTQIRIFEVKTWIPDTILLIICISILITLYNLFDNRKYSILTIFILLLGFGSRMIMSFSPTIWASKERTFIFMYLSILICSVVLYLFLQKQKNKIAINITNYIILIMSFMSFVNMLCIN